MACGRYSMGVGCRAMMVTLHDPSRSLHRLPIPAAVAGVNLAERLLPRVILRFLDAHGSCRTDGTSNAKRRLTETKIPAVDVPPVDWK